MQIHCLFLLFVKLIIKYVNVNRKMQFDIIFNTYTYLKKMYVYFGDDTWKNTEYA